MRKKEREALEGQEGAGRGESPTASAAASDFGDGRWQVPRDVDEESSAPPCGLLRLHQELFSQGYPLSPSLFPRRSFSPCCPDVSSVVVFFGCAASSGPRKWIDARGGAGMSATATAASGSPPSFGSVSSLDSDPPEQHPDVADLVREADQARGP